MNQEPGAADFERRLLRGSDQCKQLPSQGLAGGKGSIATDVSLAGGRSLARIGRRVRVGADPDHRFERHPNRIGTDLADHRVRPLADVNGALKENNPSLLIETDL